MSRVNSAATKERFTDRALRSGKRAILLWMIFCLSISRCFGQTQAEWSVEVMADLLDAFGSAQVSDASECAVQRPASAGGVKQSALFEHPKSIERPARAQYQIDLPPAPNGDRIFLAFDLGIRDGVKWDQGADGVRFMAEVDGKKIFARVHRACRWESCAADLTSFAGRKIALALLTDAIANTSYDWAVWGNPRILRFQSGAIGTPNTVAGGMISSSITSGALAFRYPAQNAFKLRLKPLGAGAEQSWNLPAAPATNEWAAWMIKDFNFPSATGVQLEWEPKTVAAADNVMLAAYRAQPKLLRILAATAVLTAREPARLQVEWKNQGRGKLAAGEARLELQAAGQALAAYPVPALEPGQTGRWQWDWQAPDQPGVYPLAARLIHPQFPDHATGSVEVFAPPQTNLTKSIQNESLKLEFVRQAEGFAYAKVFARQNGGWQPVAMWRPLFRILSQTQAGVERWEIRPREWRDISQARTAPSDAIEFTDTARDAEGVAWSVILRIALEPKQPLAHLHYAWKTDRPRRIDALWGPDLNVGDGTLGEAKSWGLFPGLEYLYGAERSSNPRDFSPPLADRRTPQPAKITIPLMAVTLGADSQDPPAKPDRFFAPDSLKDQPLWPKLKSQNSNLKSDITVALLWNPAQRWDGEHAFPSARFAAPNFDEGMQNNRLGLFLPSVPDFLPENAERASKPYLLPAGNTLTLDAELLVAPGPAAVAVREWLRASNGLPKPNSWPRSFQQELDVCRAGFLKTVWDAASQKWRHCIGWAPSHAPGFAALLWLDSHLAESAEARRQSGERVALAAANMLREGGPTLLTSQANCHILQWEFPFLYGYLPEALSGLENQVRNLMQTQRPDGGWTYQPGNEQQADLGQAGDSVLGTCANHAAFLLRYARITDDAPALRAGENALRFMEQFRVPRGGQTWECPMYEPDILAAAYAIRAYHDGFRATGNARWLQDAVYWAETGLPFIYLWALPDRPMMLGATIPVFGSTFYTHTWLGVPVQWCGLVYAYHVFHLAEELARRPLPNTDSPLPLALHFSAADWKRVVELITVSGMHQQFAEGDRIGAYPDSISRFEQRNGAFINPEDILLNVLVLQGQEPDVKTTRLKGPGGTVVISSGARIENARLTAKGVRFDLAFFPGEPSHTLTAGLKPREVHAQGKVLPQAASPVRRDPGWWWDAERRRAYLVVAHELSTVPVEIDQE